MFGKKVGMVCASRSLWWSMMSNVKATTHSEVRRNLWSHVESFDFKTTTALKNRVFRGSDCHCCNRTTAFSGRFCCTETMGSDLSCLPLAPLFSVCLLMLNSWIGIPRRGRPKTSTKTSKNDSKCVQLAEFEHLGWGKQPLKICGLGLWRILVSEPTGVGADPARESKHLWPMSNHSVPRLENQRYPSRDDITLAQKKTVQKKMMCLMPHLATPCRTSNIPVTGGGWEGSGLNQNLWRQRAKTFQTIEEIFEILEIEVSTSSTSFKAQVHQGVRNLYWYTITKNEPCTVTLCTI